MLEGSEEMERYNSATKSKRIIAFLLDYGLFLLFAIGDAVMKGVFDGLGLGHLDRVLTFIFSLNVFLYLVLCTYLFGGTVGKLIMRLRVVEFERNRITLFNSVIRGVPFYLPWLLVPFAGLNDILLKVSLVTYIAMMCYLIYSLLNFVITKNDRTIHDKLAKTYVVSRV